MKTTLLLAAAATLSMATTHAETLQSAKVTTRVNDVRLYQQKQSGRQAKEGDRISGHTSVQTGRRSRAELTFQDNTVSRLGANSTFSFRRGSRDINLNQGSILLQVPKSAGGATIRTATVTAAITGTTLLMEYNVGKWVKLITLEGNVGLKLGNKGAKGGLFGGRKRVNVPAGKMIIMRPNGEIITKPVDVDLKRLLASSILAGDKTFGPLSDEARLHIADAVAKQEKLKREGILLSQHQVERHPGSSSTNHRNSARDVHGHQPQHREDPTNQPPNPPEPPTEGGFTTDPAGANQQTTGT